MGLHLGSSEELKVILNGVVYRVNFYTNTLVTNGIRLLSSENYILKDSDGQYLTVDEEGYITIIENDNI